MSGTSAPREHVGTAREIVDFEPDAKDRVRITIREETYDPERGKVVRTSRLLGDFTHDELHQLADAAINGLAALLRAQAGRHMSGDQAADGDLS